MRAAYLNTIVAVGPVSDILQSIHRKVFLEANSAPLFANRPMTRARAQHFKKSPSNSSMTGYFRSSRMTSECDDGPKPGVAP
jgi:hypothetical protein